MQTEIFMPVSRSCAKRIEILPYAVSESCMDGRSLMEQAFFEDVRKTAYDLYCRRGMAHAHDIDDWLTAETIVSEQYAGNGKKDDEWNKVPNKKGVQARRSRKK